MTSIVLGHLRLDSKSGPAYESDPCDRNGPLGDLLCPQGHPKDPSETPRGPPGDAPGTRHGPWGLRSKKTATPPQISSPRSSRLLHPNPFVATHHPKDSHAFFYHVYYENAAPFGPLELGLRTGFTPVLWPLVPWLYMYLHVYDVY